jgi:hypothetical protein
MFGVSGKAIMCSLKQVAATITGSSYMTYSGDGTPASHIVASSTNQGIHGSTAYLNFTYPSSGTLYYTVSVSSEARYDYARLYVNGANYVNIAGEDSRSGSVSYTAGTTIQLQYYKDGSVNRGSDAGYFSDIYLQT